MTEGFALDYIPRRMKELGYEDYHVRYRAFQLAYRELLKLTANNQFFLLIDPPQGVSVKSKFGEYNLADTNLSEMQHEHRGTIYVLNNGVNRLPAIVKFIQVIPKHKPKH